MLTGIIFIEFVKLTVFAVYVKISIMLVISGCAGTTDRILLITGLAENVRNAHQATWEKIYNRPDANKAGLSEELKVFGTFSIAFYTA
jgi:hypothetical protein